MEPEDESLSESIEDKKRMWEILTRPIEGLTVVPPTAVIVQAPPSKNPARVYVASLGSASSRRTMEQALGVIADIAAPGHTVDSLPWAALRFAETQAIRARLEERYDAASANKMLSALRQTLKNAWRLGLMSADDYMKAADIANVKGEKPDQAAGRALTLGELMALVGACADGTPSGTRDAAMLAVAYAGGLRRAEIVALDLADLDTAKGVLTAKGKRNKVRTVPIQNGALAAVNDWLQLRGEAPGPLFYRVRKGGKVEAARLTTQAVYHIMHARAEDAGVKAFSPHDMRRTFAGDMLDAGVDISTVQKLMGHASVSTTAGYDRRGERAKVEAAKRLHFPYQGGKK